MAEYRLPTNVKPTHYAITLRTDLEKETFSGAVKIRFAQTYAVRAKQKHANESVAASNLWKRQNTLR